MILEVSQSSSEFEWMKRSKFEGEIDAPALPLQIVV